MEKRLKSYISECDFYSAHQLLISHSQRLERSGKLDEARSFLLSGLRLISSSQAPAATVFDVVSKFENLVSREASYPTQDILDILKIVLSTEEIPENLKNFWYNYCAFAIRYVDAIKIVQMLLENGNVDAVEFSVRVIPHERDVFSLIGEHSKDVLKVTFSLLISKCFASTLEYLRSVISTSSVTPINNSKVSLLKEDTVLAQSVNLSSLLLELLRRKNPPRELFVQLQLRYTDLLKSEEIKPLWNKLREIYWPTKTSADQMNPLASLFQSMMNR